MNLNQKLVSCPLLTSASTQLDLADCLGSWVVLYFYPKDATPGCTLEGQDFRDHHAGFAALSAVVLGVSRDSVASHKRFKEREAFPFELLSDPNEELCTAFDVMKTKSLYGKTVRGIERSTFLIDPKGIVQKEWRKVKVPGHVTEVLQALKSLATPSSGSQ